MGEKSVLRIGSTVVFVVLCLWTVAKGFLPMFQTDEVYFWLATYEHGFIRRGLVGTLLAPLLQPVDPGGFRSTVASYCLVALFATIAIAGGIIWRLSALRQPAGALAIGALWATSPFLGLLAHNIGYPDGVLAATLLVVSLLVPGLSAFSTAGILLLLSAIHELGFLLTLPLVLFSTAMRQDWDRRDFAIVGLASLLGLLVPSIGGAPSAELVGRMVAAGLSAREAQLQVAVSLHQGLIQALHMMIGKWYSCFQNALFGLVYAGLPSLCIAWLGFPSAAAWMAQRTHSLLYRRLLLGAYLFSCLGGWAVLAIAWDLARIASFTTLTAFVTAVLVIRHAPRPPRVAAMVIGTITATGFAGLPILNLYFEYGRPLHLEMIRRICPLSAAAGISLIDVFNRAMTAEERSRVDAAPLYGNGPINGPASVRESPVSAQSGRSQQR